MKKILLIVVFCFGFGCVSKSNTRSVVVVLNKKYKVEFYFQHSHPFFAEYKRKIAIYHKNIEIKILELPQDTGGGLPIKVRYYADASHQFLRVTDELYDRLLDLQKASYVKGQNPPPGKFLSSYVNEGLLPDLVQEFEISSELNLKEIK